MPTLNFGVMPAGTAGGNELIAVTRRAVAPAVVVQIGKSTVLLSSMLAAAETVEGGVSPVTVPLQGVRMVNGKWSDYSGAFTLPQNIQGLQNAEYNLNAFIIGIPYYLFEGLVQVDAEIVPIIWARINDAGNFFSDQLALALWSAQSANDTLTPFSINDIISATNPTQGQVGGIDRVANTFWQANVKTIASITGAGTAWSRTNLLAAINSAQKNALGEAPSCVILDPGAWTAVAADAIGAERYLVSREGTYGEATEGATVAFPAINIGGIPVYADLYATDTTSAWLPNFNYFQYKIHRDAAFTIDGPASLLPQGQLGYIMAAYTLLSVITSKPVAQSKITGFTGAFAL